MITIEDIRKDLHDWKVGRMGYNALIDAIESYAESTARLKQSEAFEEGRDSVILSINIINPYKPYKKPK